MSETIYVSTTPIASDDTVFCDQIIITGSDATQGPNIENDNGFLITLDMHSYDCYVFPHDSSTIHGFPIVYGSHIVLSITNLNQVDFASQYEGGIVCWLKL